MLSLGAACAPQPTPPPTATPPPATATPLPPTATQAPTATSLPPTATPLPPSAICSPLAVQPVDKLSEIITQPFKMPIVLSDGTYKEEDATHHGVDLGYYTRDHIPFTGTPVQAVLEATVAAIVHDHLPYGDFIILETPANRLSPGLLARLAAPAGASLYTLYGHLQNLQPLELGQSVTCGQQIAETGLTGWTGGPHLHLETRWGPPGKIFASIGYYKADTTAEERANYETWRMSGTFQLFDPLKLFPAP